VQPGQFAEHPAQLGHRARAKVLLPLSLRVGEHPCGHRGSLAPARGQPDDAARPSADGTPLGEPLAGHGLTVDAVATGALPDGTPVIISGGGTDGMVRVWRLADGTPVGEPLAAHGLWVNALAVGALPDGTPVIISGGGDRFGGDATVRVWRLADGAPLVPPLNLPESVRDLALHGNIIAIAAGADITLCQPVVPWPIG
jgi:WD40 repeat protein